MSGNQITPELFGLENLQGISSATPTVNPMGRKLADMEKLAIADTLVEYNYNLAKAARALGISRATLYNKIKKYKLPVQRAGT